MPSSERFDALPKTSGDKWTRAHVKTLVHVSWVNLSVLAESAKKRLDHDSRQISRDHEYFRLQLGDAGVLGEKQFDQPLDITPVIDGWRRSKTAAHGRYLTMSSMLGSMEPLSRANSAEADRLSTFIDVLHRHSIPYPYQEGTPQWADEFKRLKKIEIKVTSAVDPDMRQPDQIIRFNEAEAQRRLKEMRFLTLDSLAAVNISPQGRNRWVTAANIAGPLAAIGVGIAFIPEAREVALNLASQAINIAQDLLPPGTLPLP